MRKIIYFGIAVILVLTILSVNVYARDYYLLCLSDGEEVEYSKCNPAMSDFTCDVSFGYCSQCVYIGSSGNYCPQKINTCNDLGLSCTYIGQNTTLDASPPVMNISSPLNNFYYNNKKINFTGNADESSDWEYLDNNKSDAKWKTLCSNTNICEKSVYFNEGFNNITIKATDGSYNSANKTLIFIVDSKKPVIKKIEPSNNKYASGTFTVTYDEYNVKEINFTVGNSEKGYITRILENCPSGKKQQCSIDIQLEEYDGTKVEYYFEITDKAGNYQKSSTGKVKVDTTFPFINSLNYTIDRRYVKFNINITEINFDKVEYYDNSVLDARWKTLCSSLRKGICSAKKSFSLGHHDLSIQVSDDAGNAVSEAVEFDIV